MPRFDLFPNPSGQGYLLDVQADLLDGLNTRIVVPIMPIEDAPAAAAILNLVFTVAERPHVMVTQFLSAVPTSLLRRPIGSLAAQSDRITRAMDFVLQGF